LQAIKVFIALATRLEHMKRILNIFSVCTLLSVCNGAFGASVRNVYVDKANNVHVTDGEGKDIQVTTAGDILDVQKSSDGITVAWRVADDTAPDGSSAPLADRGSHQVVVYRDGATKTIECEPFIRDYWFWNHGTRIGIDCGGMHFAGRELLYDTATATQVDVVDGATVPVESRPEWSNSSVHFSGD
jgi:hypothetical protein